MFPWSCSCSCGFNEVSFLLAGRCGREGHVTAEAQRERETGGCHAACIEDRGTGHELRNLGASGTGNGKMQVSEGGAVRDGGRLKTEPRGCPP